MFVNILNFEIKYWLKNWSFYLYLIAFFLLALLSMAGASGAFGEGSASVENIANSPLSIYTFANFFNKLLLFLLPAIVGESIYKDFKSNFNNIFYSYPFSKAQYLFAKFTSAFLIVFIIAISIPIGLILGTKLPSVNPTQLLPFDATPYLQPIFIFTIPNLFLFSVIVFAVVLLSRNIYWGFIAIIIFWLLKEILFRLVGSDSMAGFIFDPFGENAIHYLTRYWSSAERNTFTLPLQSIIFYNRLVWLFVALIIFTITYRLFSFSQNALLPILKFKNRKSITKDNFGSITKVNLIKANFNFSFLHQIKTSWKLSQTDFNFIIKSPAFISILVVGILFIAAILLQMNPHTDTKPLPTTWIILGLPVFFYSFLIQILTFLYAGILVHRAKNSRTADLISATAVPNWVLLFSKFLALVKMQVLLLSLIMIVGIAIQLNNAFYQIEIGHYLFDLFAIHLIGFIIWAFLALFVQSIFNNTYLSLFLLILLALGISQFPSLGIENYLVRFNESPDSSFYLNYSDMNGYGHSLLPFFLYRFYWLLFGIFIYFFTLLIWQRELTNSVFERLTVAKNRYRGKLSFTLMISLICFLSFGFYIFQQQNLPGNNLFFEKNKTALLSQFQEKFGKYEYTKQPRITSVFVQLDIFPETHSFIANGNYTLVNKTNQTIDTILIKSGFDEITKIYFESNTPLIEDDSIFKVCVYKLEKGIEPDDSINLRFTINNQANTLLTQNSNVLKNGTYLKSDIFPRLGYFANTNIKNPDDSTALANHYQSIDADLINFEAVLSTSSEQIAITSGYLQNVWQENGRNYFHYKMDIPIKFVLGFNSGEFEVIKENYKGVDLRIYNHPTHNYCLNQMMEGLKASLDYNTKYFGAYQHREARIIEFPRSLGSYATTAGNCIQMSEMRFINDTNSLKNGGIDLSFYVAAHELTHQWWGNQVIPADVLGATMITESITEYLTAKIYEKKYGKKSALKFLKIQRDRYLTGRADETEQEVPLYLVNPEQSFISYGKGAIAFYILSEYIGEEILNGILNEYLNKVKFQSPPYTTSLELIAHLKKSTPTNLHYLITDMFETTNPEKTLSHFNNLLSKNTPTR